jgi:hypothetical protein
MTYPTWRLLPPIHGVQSVGVVAVRRKECREHNGRTRPNIWLSIYPQFEYSYPMKSNIGNTVIETESFIEQAEALWSAAELDDLKDYVARNPLAGDEMPGTGGLRKLRWSRAGMGKRGGARVIYYEQEDRHTYGFRQAAYRRHGGSRCAYQRGAHQRPRDGR